MSTCIMASDETDGIRSRLFSIQDKILDNSTRTLFNTITLKLDKIEKEIKGVSRVQITHVSREQKKIADGELATPEQEAQSAAIIKHWSRVHDGHWESNFILLRGELDREKNRIFGLRDNVLKDVLLMEYARLEITLRTLEDEYNAVQAFKSLK